VDHKLPVLRRCPSAAGLSGSADMPLSQERRDSARILAAGLLKISFSIF